MESSVTGPEENPQRSPRQELDPVPETVVRRARDAFSERAAGHVAYLVSDSMLEKGEPPESHRLIFEGGGTRIELAIAIGEALSAVHGTIDLTAATRAVLHLEGSDVALAATVAGGTFTFSDVAHGLVRLSFEPVEESSVSTDWFRV